MSKHKNVAVFSTEPLTGKIGGMGIRQLEVARALSRHFNVRVFTPFKIGKHKERFEIHYMKYDETEKQDKCIRWADVIYAMHPAACQPSAMILRLAKKYNTPVAVDLFPVLYFEELERLPLKDMEPAELASFFGGRIEDFQKQLALGDFFICASEKERDYYMGMLSLIGKLTPQCYEENRMFRTLIDIVPCGVHRREPKKGKNILRGKIPGVGMKDFLIVWGGSLWDWYDSLTPVRAMARLKKTCPRAKLVFTATKHPGHKNLTKAYKETLALAEKKGLLGKNIFFYTDWVSYEDHDYYLSEADAGIGTFPEHIENAFSFRMRVMDYLWGNLPIITNPGNVLSDMIEKEKLGVIIPFGDDKVLAEKIEWMASKPAQCRKMRERIAIVKKRFYWDKVMEPLVRFCKNPKKRGSIFEYKLQPLSFHDLNRLNAKKILFLRSSPVQHSTEALNALRKIAPDTKLDILIQPGVDVAQFGKGLNFINLPSGTFIPDEADQILNGKSPYDAVVCCFSTKEIHVYANVVEFASRIPAKHYITFNDEYQFVDIANLCDKYKQVK